jgi:hypothetical protein
MVAEYHRLEEATRPKEPLPGAIKVEAAAALGIYRDYPYKSLSDLSAQAIARLVASGALEREHHLFEGTPSPAGAVTIDATHAGAPSGNPTEATNDVRSL